MQVVTYAPAGSEGFHQRTNKGQLFSKIRREGVLFNHHCRGHLSRIGVEHTDGGNLFS